MEETNELFLPAPEAVEATIINPFSQLAIGAESAMSPPHLTPKRLGQNGTKLFLIEQARAGVASVYDLWRKPRIVA